MVPLPDDDEHEDADEPGPREELDDPLKGCEVADDGRGFDPTAVGDGERQGLGLGGMRERAQMLGGEMDVRSRPGKGTTIVARIPVWS